MFPMNLQQKGALRPLTLLAATAALGVVAMGQDVSGEGLAKPLGAVTADDLLDGVGIEQHLEAMLPLNATFLGAGGDDVALGDYFDGERPTILTLNYVDCPQLCSMQLSKLTEAMAAIDLNLGEDYRVLTVSIDPRDTPEKAAGSEERYLSDYVFVSDKQDITRPDPAGGWSYLVGDKLEIDRVATAAGFSYRWVESQGEYAHQAATILCSPSGQITRYLDGTFVPPETLRTALLEAGEGKIGTLFENAFLNCLIFDSTTGQYTTDAIMLLKIAAALTAMSVAGGVFFLRRGEAQQGPSGTPAAGAVGGEPSN
jgi:protein SCO1/2